MSSWDTRIASALFSGGEVIFPPPPASLSRQVVVLLAGSVAVNLATLPIVVLLGLLCCWRASALPACTVIS